MSKAKAIGFLIGAMLVCGSALADTQAQGKAADAATLKQRVEAVQRRTPVATKLSAADYQRLARQKAAVDALVQRMEAGQPVTTQEIDQALELSR